MVNYDPKRFGFNLRVILDQLDITQAIFASRCGITQAALSMIIDGKRQPSLGTICKILNAIPVNFERLLR